MKSKAGVCENVADPACVPHSLASSMAVVIEAHILRVAGWCQGKQWGFDLSKSEIVCALWFVWWDPAWMLVLDRVFLRVQWFVLVASIGIFKRINPLPFSSLKLCVLRKVQ